MQQTPPVLLVDLDGTLIDTLPGLAAALNETLGAAGIAPFAPAEIRRFVGDGIRPLLERALAARGRTRLAALRPTPAQQASLRRLRR